MDALPAEQQGRWNWLISKADTYGDCRADWIAAGHRENSNKSWLMTIRKAMTA